MPFAVYSTCTKTNTLSRVLVPQSHANCCTRPETRPTTESIGQATQLRPGSRTPMKLPKRSTIPRDAVSTHSMQKQLNGMVVRARVRACLLACWLVLVRGSEDRGRRLDVCVSGRSQRSSSSSSSTRALAAGLCLFVEGCSRRDSMIECHVSKVE